MAPQFRLALAALSCLAFIRHGASHLPPHRHHHYRQSTAFLTPSSSTMRSHIKTHTSFSPITTTTSSVRRRSDSSSSSSRRRRMEPRCAVDTGMALYDLQIWAKTVVDSQLTHLTPVSGAILFVSGLLTSLSPCALSLVPLTIAYLSDDGADEERSKDTILFRSIMFTIGLAGSLSLLGLSATLAGRLFGSGGGLGALSAILPLSASGLAVFMGLNLLDLVRFQLPSLETSATFEGVPRPVQALLLGASSALIASPCSTPVLASILGFVATSEEPYLGAGLLFAYSLGYSTPLLVAGVLSGTFTSFLASKGDQFQWVTPVTAAILIGYGTYAGLNTIFPVIS